MNAPEMSEVSCHSRGMQWSMARHEKGGGSWRCYAPDSLGIDHSEQRRNDISAVEKGVTPCLTRIGVLQ